MQEGFSKKIYKKLWLITEAFHNGVLSVMVACIYVYSLGQILRLY